MPKFIFSFVLLCVIPLVISAQKMSSSELIARWKVTDVTQSIEAEKTYEDLVLHADKAIFHQILEELNAYQQRHADPHLHIRIKMYEFLGTRLFQRVTADQKESLKDLMKDAMLINNRQLLSEIYALYAEKEPSKIEDKLFYGKHAIDIQESIGIQYFSKAATRYFNLSRAYFQLEEYRESLTLGLNALKLLENPTTNLAVYVLQADIVALCYYELGQIDSGIVYNQKIKEAIRTYSPDLPEFLPIAKNYGDSFLPIWEGVTDGGLARGYLLQGQLDTAISYLMSNIALAKKYGQRNDEAKAKNWLGQTYWGKGNQQAALIAWNEAFSVASAIQDIKQQLSAASSLIEAYAATGQYELLARFYAHYLRLYKQQQEELNASKLTLVNHRLEHEDLKNKVQQSEQLIDKQRFTRNMIIAGFVALMLIAGLLYNRSRLKHNLRLAQAEQQLHSFKEKLIENNRVIEKLMKEKRSTPVSIEQLSESNILTDEDWKKFQHEFYTVYPLFMDQLLHVYPQLTQGEIRYVCLVKLGLNNKEIAAALGISPDSVRVTWHRLRQKLKPSSVLSPTDLVQHIDQSLLA